MNTFEEIYGNTLIKNQLQNAIRHKKVSHAYLFDGKSGMGKSLLVNTFAKTLQCEKKGITPCCSCISCITFESGNNPDIVYVTPTKTKSIGVDDIREQVNANMETRPYKYEYKIFIIENACKMTIAAQNALLKTIEEPAGFGVFLLTSENMQNFLPTVLSRVITIKMKPLPNKILIQYFTQEEKLSSEEADVITYFSEGNIGMALKLINDENFALLKEETHKIAVDISGIDFINVLRKTKDIEKWKDRIDDFLNLLYIWYRDIMIYKISTNEQFIIEKKSIMKIKEEANKYSLKNLFNKLEALKNASYALKYNANFSLVMDVMLLKLKEK